MQKRFIHFIGLIPVIGLSLLSSFSTPGQTPNCKLLIPASEGTVDGRSNASGIQPGDTICLLPGQKPYLLITHLQGTPEAPIVIINTIGMVAITQFYYGISIDSCSFIKLSGKGVSAFPYGIRAYDIDGAGMGIEGLSTDIEIEGIEISNTLYAGLICKSEPNCLFNSTRDKYVMRNISIHDNYIHDTGTEGFYIGSSFYNGYPIQCGGVDTILLPHLIRGLYVYNNRLTRTGWDGIQASSADSGCVIFGNEITYDSEEAELNQMSGIIIGEGSGCDCYNNQILNGKGSGIQIHGLGGNKVYNNLILNAGRTYLQEYPYMNAFYVGDQSTTPGSSFLFAYNTIISPKDYAIDFRNLSTAGNLFINNIVINCGRDLSLGSNISFQNNCTNPTLDLSWFVDPTNGNFDLKPSSPCVNAAITVSQLNLSFDILDRNRPFALVNDIGAYECHDSSLIAVPELISNPLIRFTIESTDRPDLLVIRYTVSDPDYVRIGLYDLTGRLTGMVVDAWLTPGDYEQQVDVSSLPAGMYIFRMTAGKENVAKKFQVCR
ncbi:MAG: right-handed parallel beta-helix repeat-containing protein [Bacteroidales bacterium]|nr:right-handed parallel beta-helix repeat-containing protein [Bacteroidales bacterium]